MIKDINDGLIINIRVSPNASKNEIIKTDDCIKVKITSQPIDGKANKAVIEFLSKQFKVPKSSVEIIKGLTSKDKTVLIKVINMSKKEEIMNFFNNFF